MTILLVEDDLDIRESLTDALEEAGYAVVGASDGVDALERLRGAAELPSLVILDLMMPRMNGIQFHEEMMKIESFRRIPVLLLTADAQARGKAAVLGVQGYLRKPVKLADLFQAVTSAITGAAGPAGPTGTAGAPGPAGA